MRMQGDAKNIIFLNLLSVKYEYRAIIRQYLPIFADIWRISPSLNMIFVMKIQCVHIGLPHFQGSPHCTVVDGKRWTDEIYEILIEKYIGYVGREKPETQGGAESL